MMSTLSCSSASSPWSRPSNTDCGVSQMPPTPLPPFLSLTHIHTPYVQCIVVQDTVWAWTIPSINTVQASCVEYVQCIQTLKRNIYMYIQIMFVIIVFPPPLHLSLNSLPSKADNVRPEEVVLGCSREF